jgi:ribonucleoside-diphosphate reductase alpha chain|tara:strand:- start:6202 stop:7848 length:1647 start_codon:yes stop_codon:yes gene_type:complete
MNRYKWLNKDSRDFLKRGYLHEGESAEQRGHDIAVAASKYLKLKGFAEKFEDYLSRGFYSLASPVWANFGRERGLPVSCNGVFIEDRMDAILEKQAEVGMQTKHGAGTSAYFGDLRGRGADITAGGTSSGPIHFMELFDKVSSVVSQSNVRRGSFAAYLPIDHPDIAEFLRIKGEGNPIQEMSFAVCISDEWMRSMVEGDRKKRSTWASVIRKRFETGYPYLFFTDNANNGAPKAYKDKNLKISASNLCSEIALHSSEKESFVCCLSSLNLLKWNEIVETDAIETLVYFLDAVMEEYIHKTEGIPFMKASNEFAKKQRALGVGVLGWHSFLQDQMIPFEGLQAQFLNMQIHKIMRERCDKASENLAVMFGEPAHLKGYDRRNMTTMAIAPTTSSSFILGQVSPSIEPLNSNYFTKDLAKGKFTYKNPYLEKLLEEKKKNTQTTWKSILVKGGSVQHLDFLSQEEKDVFKTFGEISQKEIVIQATQRQKYIDQAQSLNLMISPKCPPKQVSELLIFGWEQGIKSFYYQRSANPSQELARSILSCAACEG